MGMEDPVLHTETLLTTPYPRGKETTKGKYKHMELKANPINSAPDTHLSGPWSTTGAEPTT